MSETKVCIRCKQEFPTTLEHFHPERNKKDNLKSWCRKCVHEYNKEWKKKNSEKVREYNKSYNKKWRKANREKIKDYNKKRRVEDPEYYKNYNKEWNTNNKEKLRGYRLKTKYGISLEEKKEMYERQKGKCIICGIKLIDLSQSHLDHDHKNGIIRSLLCSHCNRGLGCFKDNPLSLIKAIMYLQRFRGRKSC